MERTLYELIITLLIAMLIIRLVSIDRFWPSKKRKGAIVSHPMSLSRRWRPSDPSRCDCCRVEAQPSASTLVAVPIPAWSSQRSK